MLKDLSELPSRYVIVPIDKAANNIAIIGKCFYIHKLLAEVGVPGDSSATYRLSNQLSEDIIETKSLS